MVSVIKPDINVYLLVDGNKLVKINANQSEVAESTTSISGLMAGDALTSIDFRPATGELYGVSSMNRIYAINAVNGNARAIGSAALNPVVNGSVVDLDFNPTVDRIRLVTNTGQNLRIHPENGAVVATDGSINGGMNPKIEAVAYTGNFAGSTSTTLYDIDSEGDRLYKQDPPNDGTLVEVGSLGINIEASAGFDIDTKGEVSLAAARVNGQWELHSVDLMNGKLTKLGDLPSGTISGLAIPTAPVSYAIDESNNLQIIDFSNVGTPIVKTISGLQSNELLVGLDFRPVNGQLYALGSSSRIYTINTSSGAATAVGNAALNPMLSGSSFGFDFNPTVDRIRVVSETGQNLRLHPETGAVAAIDGTLKPGNPMVSASAYTNNFAGATSTVLYNLDFNTDRLYKQDPPNDGTLVEVGSLGVNIEAVSGFDIGSTSGMAYAALKVGNDSAIYSINLTSGMATKLTDLPVSVRAFALGTGF